MRLQLSLDNCRGQCYDGASNMLGPTNWRSQENPGSSAKGSCNSLPWSFIKPECEGCTTKNYKLISNTMDTAKEVVTLIKFSPKRESLLGEIQQNIQERELATHGIIKLCPTRWTVSASCFPRVLDNY